MCVRGVTVLPWQDAAGWSQTRRVASLIAAGEAQGLLWDHAAWCWREPSR